jgi:hypothetical protein
MENNQMIFYGTLVSLLLASSFMLLRNGNKLIAQQDVGITLLGIEIEVYISIASSILAIFLFAISALAYRREKRSRMLFVMSAFFLFAVKGLLIAIDEVLPPQGLTIEPIALLLDFGVLLLFFLGLVKK